MMKNINEKSAWNCQLDSLQNLVNSNRIKRDLPPINLTNIGDREVENRQFIIDSTDILAGILAVFALIIFIAIILFLGGE